MLAAPGQKAAAAVDNDDAVALESLEITEVLALVQHATTQIQSLTRSNASIAALLAGRADGGGDGSDGGDGGEQDEVLELDEEDRAELALALRENRDIIARKKARLERLIGIYEAKGGEASTSLGEARAALLEPEAAGPADETAAQEQEQQPMDEDDGGITL
ncbi:hypothetical protein FA10DRAFT_192123 [Acaromyces ingoldii]|uniref:Mediator complex subunit 9 n=1 Tax=Acaromyces ingoldii TaxID=215250 RepID=A0A316YCR4_9BASI|nr:hypothetical protein FA10DRAFT_192123 [Acaromyces ingoldii]PWN87032.1 hypothetical protein FA10DRAFT_192123 [Acaromyces ingoldii]